MVGLEFMRFFFPLLSLDEVQPLVDGSPMDPFFPRRSQCRHDFPGFLPPVPSFFDPPPSERRRRCLGSPHLSFGFSCSLPDLIRGLPRSAAAFFPAARFEFLPLPLCFFVSFLVLSSISPPVVCVVSVLDGSSQEPHLPKTYVIGEDGAFFVCVFL